MHRRAFLVTAAAFTITQCSYAQAKPMVWRINTSDWYLAPTLEEAIHYGMELSGQPRWEVYKPGHGAEPLTGAELANMRPFYDDFGNEHDGLTEYQLLLAKGVRTQPFSSAE